ncbi:transmembrane protein 223 [Malaya genurostris]|uniref:transmembrane protein 223 n=1 Tax=Malaya genurostris TaxID=325434 RepID=UPI0026F3B845|nr:transmembrane protein 223 [Malaya genurostris]
MILRLLSSSVCRHLNSSLSANVFGKFRFQTTSITQSTFRFNFIQNPVFAKSVATRAYDVNTNIAKDVILFKYENPRFFRVLNFFAISQFLFWGYLTHFAYTTLRDAPVPQKDSDQLAWYEKINLGENKFRNGIAIMCFLIGYGILAGSWTFTLRSVRFLILRKGGKKVSVVTYTPFGKNRIMDVPVNCISAQESREAARVTIPIKIKNRSLFYVLDKKGEFTNQQLYDYTVGLRRNF